MLDSEQKGRLLGLFRRAGRDAVSVAAQPRRSAAWLWAIGALLIVTLAAVVWVQTAQNRLLNWSMRSDSFQSLWMYIQLEVESFELRERIKQVDRQPTQTDQDEITLRYELFVSRAKLVLSWETSGVWALGDDERRALAEIDRFIQIADPVIGENAAAPPDLAGLRRLAGELDRMHAGLRDLRLFSMHAMSADMTERRVAVDQQSLLGFALIVFMCLMLVVFGAIVVRQIDRLHAGRHLLEELNRRLSQARVDAESASTAKSSFLANMSHELRTPFQGLLGMLELIEQGALDSHQQAYLRTARDSAYHLLRVLDDVLDISKLESGRLDLSTEPTELRRLLGDIESLMRGHAKARRLELTVICDADVPHWVLADPTRVKQILFNLISNAIKFTESGSVSLRVESWSPARPGEGLRFEVRDTGIGIDAETMARLFTRFEQADASTSRRYGGTGLGLEISRNLARLMGGDIVATSHPGQGSCFVLDVPLIAVAPPERTLAQVGRLKVPPLAILVADDNDINRRFMRALLERHGHRVTLCSDGLQTFERVRDGDFDIVLLDIHMPVMDGLAAARAIRQLPGLRGRICIAAISADAFDESRKAALAAGADHFVTKPVRSETVMAILSGQFGVVEAAAAIADAEAAQSGVAALPPPPLPPFDPTLALSEIALIDLQRRRDLSNVISARQIDHITQILRRQIDTALPKLRAACDGADATQLNLLAHSLKGAALEVGLPQVAELARIIEAAGREMEGRADRQALLAQVAGAIEAIPVALARSLVALDEARGAGAAT